MSETNFQLTLKIRPFHRKAYDRQERIYYRMIRDLICKGFDSALETLTETANAQNLLNLKEKPKFEEFIEKVLPHPFFVEENSDKFLLSPRNRFIERQSHTRVVLSGALMLGSEIDQFLDLTASWTKGRKEREYIGYSVTLTSEVRTNYYVLRDQSSCLIETIEK